MNIERRLYRGKRKDNGEWVVGYLWIGADHTYITPHNLGVGYDDATQRITAFAYEVIPETVGQYTGLTDESEKRIFEGDIVTGLFHLGLIINSVCEFNNGSFGLQARQCGAEHFHPFTSMCNVTYEVVGNIHDNPELLKGDGRND